jgi:hypothetical protein
VCMRRVCYRFSQGHTRIDGVSLPARRAVLGNMVNSQLTPTQNNDAPNMPDIQGYVISLARFQSSQ